MPHFNTPSLHLRGSTRQRYFGLLGMTLVEVILALTLMGLLSGAMGMALYNTSLSGIRSNQNSMIDNEMRIFVELVQRHAQTSDFALSYKSPDVEDRNEATDRLSHNEWGDFIVFVRMGMPELRTSGGRLRPVTKLWCIARPDHGPTVYMYTIDVPENQGFETIEQLLPTSTLGSDAVPIAAIEARDVNPDGIFYVLCPNQFQFILPLTKTYRDQMQSAFCQTFVVCPNFL